MNALNVEWIQMLYCAFLKLQLYFHGIVTVMSFLCLFSYRVIFLRFYCYRDIAFMLLLFCHFNNNPEEKEYYISKDNIKGMLY